MAETDHTGEVQRTYTRGHDLLATTRTSTENYLADHLGSIRGLTDDQGNLTQGYAYTAFGTLLDPPPTHNNPYLFAGQRRDLTTGLDDLRARWMLPGLGRFASVDPFAGTLAQPISQHPYLYANSNPLRFVDPAGRFALVSNPIGAAVFGALLAIGITLAINGILGRYTTEAEIYNAGVMGFALTGLAAIHPFLAVGLFTWFFGEAIYRVIKVETSPTASSRERVAAWSVLAAHVGFGWLGIRYYRNALRSPEVRASAGAEAPELPLAPRGSGTVWDSVKPTQPPYEGTAIPRSFELSTANGRVWVHGNATKHIYEFIKSLSQRGVSPAMTRLLTQQQIRSLQAAVEAATAGGVPYGRLLRIGGWELKFGPPKASGQLPELFHARSL